jgi:serine/threonine protein kinase
MEINLNKELKNREIKKYKKGNLIGEGSFGKVYQGFDEELGCIIAIKEIELNFTFTNLKNDYIEKKISSFEQEINILSRLNHKNIIRYLGTNRTDKNFHIFLDICIGGSISKMLQDYGAFSEIIIKLYTKQILEGLEYLHSYNIIHRGKIIKKYKIKLNKIK